MKITKSALQRIIREELGRVLNEQTSSVQAEIDSQLTQKAQTFLDILDKDLSSISISDKNVMLVLTTLEKLWEQNASLAGSIWNKMKDLYEGDLSSDIGTEISNLGQSAGAEGIVARFNALSQIGGQTAPSVDVSSEQGGDLIDWLKTSDPTLGF